MTFPSAAAAALDKQPAHDVNTQKGTKLNNLSHDEQKELAEDFPAYDHQDGRFEIPEIQLVHAPTQEKAQVKKSKEK
jgi:hypothetical protein